MKIDVFTDGSATIATKPGGWGYVIVIDNLKVSEGWGHMELASNNDAELQAAIQGLAAVLKMRVDGKLPIEAHEVTLVSDSQIILGWTTGTYRFKQTAKIHMYNQLQYLVKKLNVKTRWVEGHSGDEHNERCDKLANIGRKGESEEKPKKTRKNSTNELKSQIEALKLEVAQLKEELSRSRN